MKRFYQLFIGIVIGAILFGSVSTFAANRNIEAFFNNIKITIDGKEIKTDAEPLLYAGRTYVPVRFIAEAFGAEVKWNETTNTVEITKGKTFSDDTITQPSDSSQETVPVPEITQTPAPETSPSPKINPPSENKEITVYITKTGEKYHTSGCRYLKRSRIPISLDSAIDQGYSPCSVCNPPR